MIMIGLEETVSLRHLAYSLNGYLWAISSLAVEKLLIRCVIETLIIKITPPLQIVHVGNGCEASSDNIYIPTKSELTATLQSITRSQFFLDFNFNYINVSNLLVWYNFKFAKLTETEIKTQKNQDITITSCVYGYVW